MFFVAAVLAIFAQSVLAQQPVEMALVTGNSDKVSDKKVSGEKDENKKPSENELMLKEVQDLQQTVRVLENRIKELENKLAKPENAKENVKADVINDTTTSANTTTTVTSIASTGVIAPNPITNSISPIVEDPKPEDKDKNASDKVLDFFKRTEVSGFVDAYYGYNFNRPIGSTNVTNFDNQLRNFDTKHNQFSLNQAKLVLENKPTEDGRLGFRFDLNFGPATEIIHAGEPGGADIFRNLQQAYLSYLAPVGKGLQVDFGKFVTYHGFEVIETKDNWNYSRSILFAFGIPYYHYGVRLTYSPSDKVTLGFAMHNGYNDVIDNNRKKSFSVQAILKPTKKLTIYENYTGGPEQPNNGDDYRHLNDGTLVYAFNDKITFATNYFYVSDRVNGAGVHAKGIVGYLRLQPKEHYAFTPRFEVYHDHDGFTTGQKQTVKSFTLTGERLIKSGLIGRLEYRRDFSNINFFHKSVDSFVKAQSTLTLGVIYSFSTKQ
jgi:hypothetical protein